jgi:hypothetical protein
LITRGNVRCFASQSRIHVAARELGACRAKSERFFVPRQRDCVDQQPHAAAALLRWTRTRLLTYKQTNEFAARAIDTRLKYNCVHSKDAIIQIAI